MRENRARRDQVPHAEKVADVFVRRFPPLRVDCTYLVTTWSNEVGAVRVAEEHRLLGQALQWLSRFGTVPDEHLRESLIDQPYPPLTLVARMESKPNVGEFWSALGGPAKASLHACSRPSRCRSRWSCPRGRRSSPRRSGSRSRMCRATREGLFEIAGTVRDAAALAPIADAEVTLLELDRAVQTDGAGHFRFAGLESGPYTLQAAASGFVALEQAHRGPGHDAQGLRSEPDHLSRGACMPVYLSPGVYVEEVPGTPPIVGVGTSTAAFIGVVDPAAANPAPPAGDGKGIRDALQTGAAAGSGEHRR